MNERLIVLVLLIPIFITMDTNADFLLNHQCFDVKYQQTPAIIHPTECVMVITAKQFT